MVEPAFATLADDAYLHQAKELAQVGSAVYGVWQGCEEGFSNDPIYVYNGGESGSVFFAGLKGGLFEFGVQGADAILDEIPYFGQVKGFTEASTGKRLMINGRVEDLGALERVGSGVGVIPGGSTAKRVVGGLADAGKGLFRGGKELFGSIGGFFRKRTIPVAPKAPLTGTYRGRTINVEINTINIRNGKATETGSGIEYAWRNHGSLFTEGKGQLSKSKFSISKDRLKEILGRRDVVTSPVRQSGTTGNYIREVDVGEIVGHLPLNKGGDLTSVMTIITDIKGNIVNVFPGRLGRGATLP